MTWHSDLPYARFRQVYRDLRSLLFTRRRPTGRYFRVNGMFLAEGSDEATRLNVARIEEVLGKQSYAPNWEFSYNKRGEVLNLSRVVYHDSPDYPDINWWQNHIRGWPVDGHPGALDLRAHWEAEPTENPHEHLDGVGIDVDRGMDILAEDLSGEDLSVEEVVWPDAV